MIDKTILINNLQKIRRKLCAYNDIICDCKYGADSILEPCKGEDNGCPELYLAMSILDIMTNEEYEALLYRRAELNTKAYKELMERSL